MSVKLTIAQILMTLEPALKTLPDENKQRFDVLIQKLRYQIKGKREQVDLCEQMLDMMNERDRYKRLAEENAADLLRVCRDCDTAEAELEKTKVRLADSDRLLRECANEYNSVQQDLAEMKTRLTEKIPPTSE